MNKYIFFLGSMLMIISCTDLQEHNRQNMQKVEEEMKMREFKKITETEMITWVNEEGKKIAKLLNKERHEYLSNAEIAETDPYKLLECCPSLMLDSLIKSYPMEIKKINFQVLPKGKLYKEEKEILEAYHYSLEKKEKIFENYQKLRDEVPTKFLFTSPIKIADKYVGMWSLVFPRSSIIKKL